MLFKTGDKVILVGDSITEDGRFNDPQRIGEGYVRLIHDYIKENVPDQQIAILNKGISGNRVVDLAERWQADVISQNPDWVSISIGINDVWRQLDSPDIDQITPKQFAAIYRNLLQDLRTQTNANIILMEPTIIEEDVSSEGNRLLKDYVDIVQRLAKAFDATLISTHQTFLNFIEKTPNISLTTDGVHMNDLGRKLMATTWLMNTKVMA